MKNKFPIGCIVTFKSHPLLYDFMIKGDGKLVPPFMIVKEAFIEDKKKKIADEVTGETIAERIKYTCVFFDDNKNEFKEVVLYEKMLSSFKKIHIARKNENDKSSEYESLIEEAKKYSIPEYEYGKIVYFKTKKFEIFKKRNSKKTTLEDGNSKETTTIQYIVNYSTPEFVLSGIKKETLDNLFYPDGNIKKVVSEILYKVKWFNAAQMKFSEVYLPAECFTDIQPFETKVPHNIKKEDN